MIPLFDAHNHLHDAWFTPSRDRIFADLARVGVRSVVVNGTNEADWPEVAAICAAGVISKSAPSGSQLHLLPSFGLHPWNAGNRSPRWQKNLLAHVTSHPGASIGEIGLDRWMLDRARPDDSRVAGLRRAPLDEQIEVFRWQLALAAERNLPASIHCLDAFGPLLDVLRTAPLPSRGFLLHAYSGPAEMVPAFAKLGAFFSFNGAFLEPRKERLRQVFTVVPAGRVLVETDAPAMRLPLACERFPPLETPDRALANHPANLAATYAALAETRAVPLEALSSMVAENFKNLFRI